MSQFSITIRVIVLYPPTVNNRRGIGDKENNAHKRTIRKVVPLFEIIHTSECCKQKYTSSGECKTQHHSRNGNVSNYDNINSCLSQLRSHAVAGLDNITTNDICCGRLKAVLALFFALSRYKQQSKQSKCVNNTNGFSIKAEIHQQPQTNTLSVSVGGGVSEKVSNSSATALLVQSMQNGNDTTMVNR
uniref:Uncharacterized protein n=1 Tax=Glossina morsitans morsitans TaxID=37546 RepID=A0A1B0G1B5_GLOMM